MSAALGVAWDDDDDGNEASTPTKKAKAPAKADALKKIAEQAKKQGVSSDDMKEIMKRQYNKTASKDLTDAEVADLSENFIQYAQELIADEAALMGGID